MSQALGESRWKMVQKIKPGDYLLCYLTGVSRFIGILEVTSEAFKDSTPIWKDEAFPCRLGVKVVSKLKPETAVPVQQLRDVLTGFSEHEQPSRMDRTFQRFTDEVEGQRWESCSRCLFWKLHRIRSSASSTPRNLLVAPKR